MERGGFGERDGGGGSGRRFLTLYDDDGPQGAAFIGAEGETAAILGVALRPEARGRGHEAALAQAARVAAFRMGAKWALVCHDAKDEAALKIWADLGFRRLYTQAWAAPPDGP